MKKTVILFLWLAACQILLPARLFARTDLSTSVTSGKDHYLANYTYISLGLVDRLSLDLSYGYSDSGPDDNDANVFNEDLDYDPEPIQTYTGGLNAELADNLSVRGSYSVTPKAEGFEATGFATGLTITFTGFPTADGIVLYQNFQTALDFDYSSTDNKYDVHTDSFIAFYRTRRGTYLPLVIPVMDSVETIKQTNWTIGITETMQQGTSLYLAYANYTYNPNIEEDILLVQARQTNAMLFTLSPGLRGFPKYSYEARLAQDFFSLINISADYLHLGLLQFSYNDNGTPFNLTIGSLLDDFYEVAEESADSYTLGVDYYLNSWIVVNASYNLYREVYKDNAHYYSFGITLTF